MGRALIAGLLRSGVRPELIAVGEHVASARAALARELGIPCVVGCRDAWTRLSDGMLVTVDGDAGEITTIATATDEDHSSS